MYRHPIHDIGFIAHPKTASTSAAKALEAENWWAKKPHHEADEPFPKNVISVIREPMDWYVSWYFHVRGRRNRDIGDFDEWLEEFVQHKSFPQHPPFYGLPHTTHLLFYDRLQDGLNAALTDLNLQPIELGFFNVRGREGRPASEFFDQNSKNLIDNGLFMTYDSLRDQLGDQPYLRTR